jgi:hypothetical protein
MALNSFQSKSIWRYSETGNGTTAGAARELERLRAKIGQPIVERDFLPGGTGG